MPLQFTSKDLDALKASIDSEEIVNNNMYYEGENPPILSEKDKRKPDNKIPVAYGYRIVSNLAGYAGRTGDIFINQVPEEGIDDDNSAFEQFRQEIDDENNGLLLNSQLYVETLKQGISYDVTWTTKGENGLQIKYAQVPTDQAVPVWSKELQTVKKLEYFVRFWDDSLTVGGTEAEALGLDNRYGRNDEITVNYAQVFEPGGYQVYFKAGADDWKPMGEFVAQPFSEVQVAVYRANKAARSYFQPVKILMDQFDKLISRNMNEVERFNNTLLGVLKKVPPDVKMKIDEMGLIDGLIDGLTEKGGDVFPRFISRDIPTDHARMMFETLGKLIYEIMGTPNFTAESFGTASGIALLYRLIGLEYSAAEIDVWFDQGLKKRDRLINEALAQRENNANIAEGFNPVIVHNRNLPVDIGFLAENALKLKALGISMETILKLFPKSIISDIRAEMEEIEARKAEMAAQLAQLPADNEDPEEDLE